MTYKPKHRGEPKPKYQITVGEHEIGWGVKYETEEFDTEEKAKARIKEINSRNVSPIAPDYYIQAESDIEVVW